VLGLLIAGGAATAPAQASPLTLSGGTTVGSPTSILPPGTLSGPGEVAFDSAENLYVLDRQNYRIRKYDADGTSLTDWGGTTLQNAGGIAVGTDGSIYVSLTNNGLYGNRIDRYDANGGSRTVFASLSFNPRGIAVAPNGNIFVAGGSQVNVIREYTADGTYVGPRGSAGSGPGQFANPVDVTFDAGGKMYVSDEGNSRVQKFDSTGAWEASWPVPGPGGIAVDYAGNVFVTSTHQIRQLSPSGVPVAVLGTNLPGSALGQFNYPAGLQFDPFGDLYVADQNNNRVQKLVRGPLPSLPYRENDAATRIDPLVAVDGSSDLASAEVRISAGYVAAEDTLGFSDQNGISGSYADGVLTLTGAASMASWQTALRSVTYRNSSDTPTTADRALSIRVVNVDDSTATITRAVTVTAVDDEVTPITTGSALSYGLGTGPAEVDPGLTLSDPDGGTTITSASVTILTYNPGAAPFNAAEDELAFAGLGAITGTYNSTYGTLYLSGAGTLSEYQAALRMVTYRNSNAAPTTADRRLSFVIGWGYNAPGLRLVRFVNPPAGGTPGITGVRRAGQQLTASPGTWTSATTVGFAYRWQRSDGAGGFADIDAGTGETYTLADADAGHSVRVRVTATNAEAGATAVSDALAIRAALAAPVITQGPAALTSATATLAFTGDAGATFECRLDDAAFAACSSPVSYPGLADGTHRFDVRAVDDEDHRSPTSSSTWTLDRTPAAPANESAPAATTPTPDPAPQPDPNAGAKLEVTGGDTLVVDCEVDAGSLETCEVDAYVASGTRTAGRVLVGHGKAAVPSPGQQTVPVTVVLNQRGQYELARHPEGLAVTFDIAAKPYDTTTVQRTSTERTLLAKVFRVVPADGQFAFESARLDAPAKRYLKALYGAIGTVASVRCEGHASSRERDRQTLGLHRAKAVCAYLRALGMTSRKAEMSYGFSRGRQSNGTLTGRISNRRVVLRIIR
jgi:outer membrane protein OmpA-like peptidoglycan-associated protein/sugar lactone lactonase YvrE